MALIFSISAFSNYHLARANPDGLGNLDSGLTFVVNDGPALSTSITDDFGIVSMGSGRLYLSHLSGIWQFQGEGGSVIVTQLGSVSNDYVTKMDISATTGTWSNTTLYWPSALNYPSSIEFLKGGGSTIVEEDAYFRSLTDFQSYKGGPAIYLSSTDNYIIAKDQHSSMIQLAIEFLPSSSGGGGGGGGGFVSSKSSTTSVSPVISGAASVVATEVPEITKFAPLIIIFGIIGATGYSLYHKQIKSRTKNVKQGFDKRLKSPSADMKKQFKKRFRR